MPPLTPPPGSHIQILEAVSEYHLIPVIDMNRPDLTNLHIPATSAGSVLSGSGAPIDFVAAVAATLLIDSVAADSDLTFTATEPGVSGNVFTVTIIQPITPDEVLTIEFNGEDATILLPTDGAGLPVAVTATAIKAAWDAAVYAPLPMAYPLTNYITVAVEGTGAGAVDATILAELDGGVDAIPGTGTGSSAKLYVDVVGPGLYVNVGTAEEPNWTAV